MFFTAYIGDPKLESAWRDALRAHAKWLSICDYVNLRLVADGRVFAFGWASLNPPDTGSLVVERGDSVSIIPLDALTRAEALSSETPRGFQTTATRVDVSLLSGEVRVAVPALALEQFYYARVSGGWLLGNDLRFLIRMAGLRLDERAIHAIFQYGTIPSPLTISRTVRRVVPGHVLTLPPDGSEPRLRRFFDACDLKETHGELEPEERIRAALDSVITRAPDAVAVHFSGGVDSSLIAARLAALGRTDARLQNFTSGPGDPFHELAPQIAAHLSLPCEQVLWQPSGVAPILESLAQEYATPFSDPAALPTVMLARAMSQWPQRPAAVMVGTAAGSLFAIGTRVAKFRRIYAVPRVVRRAVGATYPLGLWRSPSGLARVAGAANKTAALPVEYATSMGHASLHGFAYVVPPGVRAEVEQTARVEIDILTKGLQPQDRFSFTGMLRSSMCLCGARAFDPLRWRGIATVIPLAEPKVLRTAFSLSWDEKCPNGVERGVLKGLLARQVPREWVYRPKGSFLLPYYGAFGDPAAKEFVRDMVFAPGNPVLALCRPAAVGEIFHRLETGQPMHSGGRSFAWAMTFLSAWLSQLPRG